MGKRETRAVYMRSGAFQNRVVLAVPVEETIQRFVGGAGVSPTVSTKHETVPTNTAKRLPIANYCCPDSDANISAISI